MKHLIQSTLIVLISVGMFSCSNGQDTAKSVAIAENVNVDDFASRLEGSQILDVRTPEEWSQGIIEGAVMMNFYDNDFDDQLAKLDKEKPVAVYCKSGGRSGNAMSKMNTMGFKEVYNLNGGMGAWKGAGKPTTNP
ncbi:rhodanese-like domain-containing protein [Bacteroidota bacterium]